MLALTAPPGRDVEFASGGFDAVGGAFEYGIGGLGVFVALVAPVVRLGGHFLWGMDRWVREWS